ncbi:hypothetical protein Pcinc_030015 [Petrolisthes cinctipes]|uniref:G-protein coupled receptors family 1 profile domain-containing protein n=1 Tax=Petrolisthes cinctipes TaxID=88211 RepID=A0AAE1K373_PETCI|nr:hypothetical protein Pcinc_030015 [Petrolisthes cinctipes]
MFSCNLQVCTDRWPDEESGNLYFVLANLVMCYLLPLTVISVCYILIWRKVWRRKLPGEQQEGVAMMMQRSKIKVIKMLLVVVILFALSWLPLYAIFARLKLGVVPTETETHIIHMLAPIAQWLGASNSCINPILYAFFNDKFRAGFKAILVSHSCCSPLRLETVTTKSVTSMKAGGTVHAKASSEFSVYSSCSSGSAETRRKSVLVQIPLDNHSGGKATTTTTATSTPVERRRVVGQGQNHSYHLLSQHNRSPSTSSSTTSSCTNIASSTKPTQLYRQCIINNLTNGSNTTTTTTTTPATTTSTCTTTNGCSTLV